MRQVTMRHQRVFAWISLLGALAAALAALGDIAAVRAGLTGYAQGLRLMVPVTAIGAAGLIAGLIWLMRALIGNNSACGRIAAIGLCGALVVVGIPLREAWLAWTKPPIHDISTDIGDAPQFRALLKLRGAAPNPPDYDGPKTIAFNGERLSVALAQRYSYRDIKPLQQLRGPYTQDEFYRKYFWRALNAVNALGWQVAGYDIKTGRIEAASASLWFGVKSDIVIRVRLAGSYGVTVDIRAKSRIGDNDRGRNAALVRDFIARVRGG
jgi:hypothetical protein